MHTNGYGVNTELGAIESDGATHPTEATNPIESESRCGVYRCDQYGEHCEPHDNSNAVASSLRPEQRLEQRKVLPSVGHAPCSSTFICGRSKEREICQATNNTRSSIEKGTTLPFLDQRGDETAPRGRARCF